MGDIVQEFEKVLNNQECDAELLYPILVWLSGYELNIELCQDVNKKYYYVPKNLNIRRLIYNNRLKKIIKYPSSINKSSELDFFYNDICRYYGWTRNELEKNKSVLDIEYLRNHIPKIFGYSDKEIKLLRQEGKNA